MARALLRLRSAAVLALALVAVAGCGGHASLWTTPASRAHSRFAALVNPDYAVTLHWAGVTVSGQTGYYTYLNGTQVGSPTAASFTFTSLACGATYTLGVRAHDGSGNTGALSQTSYTSGACAATPTPQTLISQGQPAYCAGNCTNATPSNMVDAGYDYLRCTPPCAGIVDLSSASSALRTHDVVTWWNNTNDFDYVDNFYGGPYNLPQNYTIDANAAAGGGSPPSTGWVTLETVTANKFNAGQWDLNLSSYNWLRMSVTQSAGSSGNTDAAWHLDVDGCSSTCTAPTDTWLFLGDSITNNTMGVEPTSPPNFMQTVHTGAASFYPSEINAGLSGWKTSDMLATDSATGLVFLNEFLNDFPGTHYVTINLGTNDVDQNVSASTVLANLETAVQTVVSNGDVPIVPTIPWAPSSCNSVLAADNPATPGTANYMIVHTLYPSYPTLIHGPDLWNYFYANQSLIDTSNCPHPTYPAGDNAYRTEWATWALANLY